MNDWKKYIGNYENQFYDLSLKNGRQVQHCWPWKGSFTPVDGSGSAYIEGYRVDSIRLSERQWDWENPELPVVPTPGI